ncbi:MAG: hypothetical protein [Microvirus sp.]|nr:MAG: hypothetical protein [Microvirus sp.]
MDNSAKWWLVYAGVIAMRTHPKNDEANETAEEICAYAAHIADTAIEECKTCPHG